MQKIQKDFFNYKNISLLIDFYYYEKINFFDPINTSHLISTSFLILFHFHGMVFIYLFTWNVFA